jgi:uncharacterized iron-regulated membrane protein
MMSVRTVFLKLHLWIGLASALLVLVLAATGTILVFDNDIDRVLNPQLLTVSTRGPNLPLATLIQRVRAQLGNRPLINVGMYARQDLAWSTVVGGKQVSWAWFDPHTGQVTGTRPRDKHFIFYVHQLHVNLLAGKGGQWFVGYGTACLMFLMISGLVLWWRRKLLAMRIEGSWKRINFDLHHISGIYSMVFLLVVVGTGLLMSFPSLWGAVEVFTGDTARIVPDERPESVPQKGVPAISPDQALAIAQKQLPGAQPTFMMIPIGPKAVYNISFKYPEDQTPGGRSQVQIEKYTGEVLWVDNARKASTGLHFANNLRPLHTGDIYGIPSRLVYALASFSVVVQAVTGVIIWLVRTFKKKTASAAAAADPVETAA